MNTLREVMQRLTDVQQEIEAVLAEPQVDDINVVDMAEQPAEQEPVAWMSPGKERLEFSRKDTVYGSHTIPLYAAPQPAKREPLTTQEIDAVMRKALGYGLSPSRDDLDFARAIERAHGIGDQK